MRSLQPSSRPPSQRHAAWTITTRTDNLRALFRARYFLAGVLIGAVIFLVVFLSMQ